MMLTTTTMWMLFINSTTKPNDMKRRSTPRSLMMRESSCPDSHDLWNRSGRRCS